VDITYFPVASNITLHLVENALSEALAAIFWTRKHAISSVEDNQLTSLQLATSRASPIYLTTAQTWL
jgi:hypothetical protein